MVPGVAQFHAKLTVLVGRSGTDWDTLQREFMCQTICKEEAFFDLVSLGRCDR